VTISHHPGEDLLFSYASGAADEAVSLLIATHLALCSSCRRDVARAEHLGGALLLAIEPVSLQARALEQTMARLAEPEGTSSRQVSGTTGIFPEPLQGYLPRARDSVRWRRIVGGLYCQPLLRAGAASAMLIKAMPGSRVAMHRHRGQELTLVLAGGYTDSTGHYARGDVQDASAELDHELTPDDGEPCITLAVTNGPLVFRSWLAGLVGRFSGF
jgi:putative transcriptional regulator